MPITLAKIAANTAKISISVASEQGTDALNITYYPSRVTEKTFAQLQRFDSMGDASAILAGFQGLNEVLCSLIKEWDLYEDDEQTIMYPLTPEKLAELPIPFRMQVVGAIMGDIRPEVLAP